MKHVSTKEISGFIDGTLSVARMREVAKHFDICSICRNELRAWETTRSMFRRAPKPASPDADFWAATTARLQEESERNVPPAVLSFNTYGRTRTRIVSSFAVAAALVGCVIFVPKISNVTLTSQPGIPSPASDTIDADDMSSFVKAHTEAAAVQPLADDSRQVMLATDVEDAANSNASSGDAAAYADSNP